MTNLILLRDWQASQIEFWRKTEYESYDVSSFGRVRRDGRILRFSRHRQGYHEVKIYLGSRENRKIRKVHRLVAIAFLPKVKGLTEVNHKTAVKNDNRVDNLEWTSRLLNQRHAWHVGIMETAMKPKLTPTQAVEIKQRALAGQDKELIAREFGVSRTTVWDILTGRTYAYIEEDKTSWLRL